MNGNREDKAWCDFHPTEEIIGVCPLCLNERLLILAAKQGNFTSSHSVKNRNLPKLSAFASLLLHRFDFHHKHQFHNSDYTEASSSSREDSFISIKFDQDNGVGSWEKSSSAVSKVSLDRHRNIHSLKENNGTKEEEKRVVEHAKVLPRGGSLRWRKRIGHLFQLNRWKRSGKGSGSGHVGSKLEGVKVRSDKDSDKEEDQRIKVCTERDTLALPRPKRKKKKRAFPPPLPN